MVRRQTARARRRCRSRSRGTIPATSPQRWPREACSSRTATSMRRRSSSASATRPQGLVRAGCACYTTDDGGRAARRGVGSISDDLRVLAHRITSPAAAARAPASSWRTRFTVVPCTRSLSSLCPCVAIATRSTCSAPAVRMIWVAGSPALEPPLRVESRRAQGGREALRGTRGHRASPPIRGAAARRTRGPPSRRRRGAAAAARASGARAAGRARGSSGPRRSVRSRQGCADTRRTLRVYPPNRSAIVWYRSQHVQRRDDDRHGPGERTHPEGQRESAHLAAVGRELQQREHREGQLQAEHHLTQNQQRPRAPLAVPRR